MPHLSNAKKNKYAPNVNHEGDMRFVKDVENDTLLGYKYFNFTGKAQISVTARGSAGVLTVMTKLNQPLAKIKLMKTADREKSEAVSFNANRKLSLYFIYNGKGKIDILDFEIKSQEKEL